MYFLFKNLIFQIHTLYTKEIGIESEEAQDESDEEFSELFYKSDTDQQALPPHESLEYDSLSASSEMEAESDEHEEGNTGTLFMIDLLKKQQTAAYSELQ